MPYCEQCGTELHPDDRFCQECGTERVPPSEPGAQEAPRDRPREGAPGERRERRRTDRQRRRDPQREAPPEETGRRNVLKYGAVGALALAGAGGAWFALGGSGSGGTVVQNFDSGVGAEWNGDVSHFLASTDSKKGKRSATLQFAGGTEVWRRIEPTTASELSFWWKSQSVADNEYTVWFHDLDPGEEPDFYNAQFGFEVGAENDPNVVAAPPLENDPDFELLTDDPVPNAWYKTRLFNVDYATNTFDVELQDSSGNRVGLVSGHEMAGDPESVNAIYIRNHQNYSRSAASIDHIVKKS